MKAWDAMTNLEVVILCKVLEFYRNKIGSSWNQEYNEPMETLYQRFSNLVGFLMVEPQESVAAGELPIDSERSVDYSGGLRGQWVELCPPRILRICWLAIAECLSGKRVHWSISRFLESCCQQSGLELTQALHTILGHIEAQTGRGFDLSFGALTHPPAWEHIESCTWIMQRFVILSTGPDYPEKDSDLQLLLDALNRLQRTHEAINEAHSEFANTLDRLKSVSVFGRQVLE